jgi:hypothetical protein
LATAGSLLTGDKKRATALKAPGITLDHPDYVLCVNEDETTKDRHDRKTIVAVLDALRRGDTALAGPKACHYARSAVSSRSDGDNCRSAV